MLLRVWTPMMVAALLSAFSSGTYAGGIWEDGRGLIDSEVVVADPSDSTKPCYLGAGTRFDMAPDAESSASAPSRLVKVPPSKDAQGKPINAGVVGRPRGSTGTPNVSTPCETGYSYRAKLSDIDSRSFYAELVVGAAIIPFKYYMSGDKGVKSNTTALGYFGLKRHTPGGDYILGLGAGPAQISVPGAASNSSTTGGAASSSTSTSTQAGFTLAIVALGQLRYDSTAQFGIAFGQDRVSKSAAWQDNGKWWVGLQVGTSFF